MSAVETLPRTRLFVDADLAAGAAVSLKDGQAHYLRNVLRLGPGAAVLLFNGRDGEWVARLDAVGRSEASLTLLAQSRPQGPGTDLWLCFAPVKKAAVDAIAEKTTELGAPMLQPVFTEFTDVTRVNTERLRAHAVEASEQCERLDVPEVREPVGLRDLLRNWDERRSLLVCAEAGPARPIAEAARALRGRPVAFLVGPEGGLSQSELDAFSKLPFVHPVGLGPRILRADTAVLAALATWQAISGDGTRRPPRPETGAEV